MTGVKFENKANSKVVLGVRQSKTVSGIRFDPKTHKQITHVFKEAAPLEAEFAALSLEELKAATKQLVAEIKQQKKGGASAEKLGQLKQRLKEMKRAQDDKAAEDLSSGSDTQPLEQQAGALFSGMSAGFN